MFVTWTPAGEREADLNQPGSTLAAPPDDIQSLTDDRSKADHRPSSIAGAELMPHWLSVADSGMLRSSRSPPLEDGQGGEDGKVSHPTLPTLANNIDSAAVHFTDFGAGLCEACSSESPRSSMLSGRCEKALGDLVTKPSKARSSHEYLDNRAVEATKIAKAVKCKETSKTNIRIDQVRESYYPIAISTISELALKQILTAWINTCCPQKQTNFPYGGGIDAQRSLSEYGYEGHYTAPPWWPTDSGWEGIDHESQGCRHKGPHHVNRFGTIACFLFCVRMLD